MCQRRIPVCRLFLTFAPVSRHAIIRDFPASTRAANSLVLALLVVSLTRSPGLSYPTSARAPAPPHWRARERALPLGRWGCSKIPSVRITPSNQVGGYTHGGDFATPGGMDRERQGARWRAYRDRTGRSNRCLGKRTRHVSSQRHKNFGDSGQNAAARSIQRKG